MKKTNKVKKFFRYNLGFLITTASLAVVFTAIDVVALSVPFITNTLNTVLGDDRQVLKSGDPNQYQYFKTDDDIKNKADALKKANQVNEKIGEEGFVLLKNDGSLPLKKNAKVSVFGMNQTNMVYSGSGSSSKSNGDGIDLFKSLDNAGIEYNLDLKIQYEKLKSSYGRPASPTFGDIIEGFSTGEAPLSAFNSSNPSGLAGNYTDAALVVISRIGGEGYDLPRTMKNTEGADPDAHYLELDNNEKALLSNLTSDSSPFENVIVLINSGTSMELGFLDDGTYGEKLKGALWIGDPGGTGLNALGKILTGEVTPSGHLTDTYVRDFFSIPSLADFGNNSRDKGNNYTLDGASTDYYFVDYQEGIYVGYKYFETRGYTEKEKGNSSWYKDNVVYPFGYGMSYAKFNYSLKSAELDGKTFTSEVTEADLDKTITLNVEVTNVSTTYSGKEVVQLYGTAPYINGQIEKSQVNLLDFAKTKLLAPGEKDEITLKTTLRDLASYDYNDANTNSHKGYELDAGSYTLSLATNAHYAWENPIAKKEFSIGSTINIDNDEVTNNKVENKFDDVSDHIQTYLSRADWEGTFPKTPTAEDCEASEELINSFSVESYIGKGSTLDKGKPWYVTKAKRQQYVELTDEEAKIKLYDLIGKKYEDSAWDDLLDQLTVKQMTQLIGTGNFNTGAISNISKPKTVDPDGPSGFTNFMTMIDQTATVYDTCFYACESLIGATYNKELAGEIGNAIGNEGLIGNERGDKRSYSGWYAPAVNIHRTPFSGRNWEYYSEDGVLNGIMAAETVKAANKKGVYTYIKHFALNDQETNRDSKGLVTWSNEQAMREIYFVPFEYTVKVGGTTAMMSSFNRIGSVWAGGNYNLLTGVLRKEWGFRGTVITDYNTHGDYMDPDQMVRAGGSLNLIQDMQPSSAGANYNVTHRASLRNATHDILYTVANSCAMNGYGAGIKYGYDPAYWKIAVYSLNGVAFVALAIWGFFSIWNSIKRIKKEDVE